MCNIIIAGSREFNDYELLKSKCDEIIASLPIPEIKCLPHMPSIRIISGTARGADKLGERYALENGFILNKFPADWDRYGKSAGYKRNVLMAEHADVLIAFWDGISRGTRHMIEIARSKGLQVHIVQF